MGDRELIDTGNDKRYVRRDEEGRFTESDDVGRSHAADQRQQAETETKKGQGDRGDLPVMRPRRITDAPAASMRPVARPAAVVQKPHFY